MLESAEHPKERDHALWSGRCITPVACMLSCRPVPDDSRGVRKRMTPVVRLVAVDLDGTLLLPDSSLSVETHNAVALARSAGIVVVLASGRMHESVAPFARSLRLHDPVISYNGGLVRASVDGEAWLRTSLEPAPVREIVELCRQRDLHLNYYAADRLLMSKDGRWAEFYRDHTGSPLEIMPGLRGCIPAEPTKLIIIDRESVTRPLEAELRAQYATRLEITRTNPEYLEFMAPGTTKAHALSLVAQRLGIHRSEVVALGDGRNDVEMLAWAGLGIAVCDGHPQAIAVADCCCASGTCNGVAGAIRSLAQHRLTTAAKRSGI